ncbi:MAG: FxsA family protein [Parvibaculales bacterium]
MSLALLLVIVLIPLIEIHLFIEVGGLLGGGVTVLLVLATAFIGVNLARRQGLSLLLNARADLARGEPPVTALGHGAMIILSGALLITPGFFTDGVGFLLLLPAVRSLIAEMVLGSLIPIDVITRFGGFTAPGPAPYSGLDRGPFSKTDDGNIVIETEFEVHEADGSDADGVKKEGA